MSLPFKRPRNAILRSGEGSSAYGSERNSAALLWVDRDDVNDAIIKSRSFDTPLLVGHVERSLTAWLLLYADLTYEDLLFLVSIPDRGSRLAARMFLPLTSLASPTARWMFQFC